MARQPLRCSSHLLIMLLFLHMMRLIKPVCLQRQVSVIALHRRRSPYQRANPNYECWGSLLFAFISAIGKSKRVIISLFLGAKIIQAVLIAKVNQSTRAPTATQSTAKYHRKIGPLAVVRLSCANAHKSLPDAVLRPHYESITGVTSFNWGTAILRAFSIFFSLARRVFSFALGTRSKKLRSNGSPGIFGPVNALGNLSNLGSNEDTGPIQKIWQFL